MFPTKVPHNRNSKTRCKFTWTTPGTKQSTRSCSRIDNMGSTSDVCNYCDRLLDSEICFCPFCRRSGNSVGATLSVLSPPAPHSAPHIESTLDFLRLPFDNKNSDGILKGDATIVVEGKTDDPLYVHKFILSIKSPVFLKMFDNKMLEEQTGIVHIDDTTLPVMRSVIKFCYDAEIQFTEEVTAEEVLAVAHKYDIALLRKITEEQLIATLNDSNLSKRLKLAKIFEVKGLEAAAITHFRDNFNNVISDVLLELC